MFGDRCLLQQEEEIQNLQKQIQQLEGDLDTAQTQLAEATTKLENTEKELSKVRRFATIVSRTFSPDIFKTYDSFKT